MSGASSKVGCVNTGIVETSSHSEIKFEIEDVEAPGDYEEVCKTSETKGLREAAHDSKWYRALARKDCKILMALLEANPCLVAETGPEEGTVLHVAAERGCLKLLYQVFNLFEKYDDKFVYKISGVEVDWFDLFTAKYGPSKTLACNMAWFTFPRQAWHLLQPQMFSGLEDPKFIKPDFGASQYLRDILFEIMQRESSKKAFRSLERRYESDLNYNFLLEHKELQFHYALELIQVDPRAKDYVKTIMQGCLDLEAPDSVEVLKYLFQLRNAQGQTPIHVVSRHVRYISDFLKLIPNGNAYNECINAKDVRGWTILHYFVATKNHNNLESLLWDNRIDVNARTNILETDYVEESTWSTIGRVLLKSQHQDEVGMTALHLAILHDDISSVELLLKHDQTNANAVFYRHIVCGHERTRGGFDLTIQKRTYWSPLQLATMKGLSNVARALHAWKKVCNIYDYEKLQNNNGVGENFQKVSPLLLACASGNPDILRLFIDKFECDPLVKFEGATTLHYATNAMLPKAFANLQNHNVDRFLYFSDFGKWDCDIEFTYEEESEDIKLSPRAYLGRQACITILLQAGVDIWEKDDYDGLADPGPKAPEEALLWWHEQMARETLDAKKSLNDAANAISVVSALVATASFVGPLQPPLGYGGDSVEGGIQDTHLSVRVFMVSNILSFYFAVASIMFAVVPSLPMPQEGIYAEWHRTRRSVGVAIFFLLLSVLGVLISFGTASNLVISEDYSWQHGGLSFYPTLLGGFICILGIILFFIRLLRLVFNGNAKIRFLYKTLVKF